ncbi:hypothetical protein VHEMI05929 [[Torrubiella] hemipterigena]|uniref:Glycoside hydrolase n=1 Tax=[Torrubiella] hemipterigena TaxID=1531966 RepID=A0A0A1THW2_9HYPO|nr:hypothetical protein VHEMI05929 [[Torrubiella] hemipterigena]
MQTKFAAVTALLAGSAVATPYAPNAQFNDGPAKIAVYTPKFEGSGNFMPSRTSPAAAAEGSALEARATGEKVSGSNYVGTINNQDGIGSGTDSYKYYSGDGTTGQGWPGKDKWVSFENMFNNYKNTMFNGCSQFGQANDSGPEVGAIYDGIQAAAKATGVDHRFILAVIMQESAGCVRAPTTNYGVRNPGLMQDHNGYWTCNDNGKVQNPCPSNAIYGMISEGTAGTNDGDGLANCINQSGKSDVSAYYRAARIYNSGSVSSTGKLQNGIATHCYASDIANRLTGWVSAGSKCTCDSNPSSCGIVTN